MGFADWLDMCPHTITVEPYVSTDQYGNFTYGTPVTYRARVQGKNRYITNTNGEEVVSSVTTYVAGIVNVKDRVTFPAPFIPTQPRILSVSHVSDEYGQHHSVVYS